MKRSVWIIIMLSLVFIYGQPLYALNDKDPLDGESLYEDVLHYSILGEHRTATPKDMVTGIWIGNRLKQAGYKVQKQDWTTRQFYPRRTEVIIGKNLKLAGFPVWWPKPTSPQGVQAEMTDDINDANGKIYLFINVTAATFSVTPVVVNEIDTAYRNGAVAVVMVTYYEGTDSIPSDEFIGLNAIQETQDELPIPVVSAMAKDRHALDEAIMNHSTVKVVSTGVYKNQAQAFNVIGTLDRGPGSKVMVVTTPCSGWFTCAGERGAGVAIFLGLAEWAARTTSNTSWIFAATSGHEIDSLGLINYMESDFVPRPEEVFAWTHIGAWQAMYNYVAEDGRLYPTDKMDFRLFQVVGQQLRGAVTANFADPALNLRIVPAIVYGDLLGVIQYGYTNLMGISYGHEFHHSTEDLPYVTGSELLEPVARAYKGTFEMIIDEH